MTLKRSFGKLDTFSLFFDTVEYFQQAQFNRSCMIGETLSKKLRYTYTNFYFALLKIRESSSPTLHEKIAPVVPRPPPFQKSWIRPCNSFPNENIYCQMGVDLSAHILIYLFLLENTHTNSWMHDKFHIHSQLLYSACTLIRRCVIKYTYTGISDSWMCHACVWYLLMTREWLNMPSHTSNLLDSKICNYHSSQNYITITLMMPIQIPFFFFSRSFQLPRHNQAHIVPNN